ncbi:ABC transporter ATP-binding protein [Spiroplasma turonicum]|uniref:ABC transporter ATP-binding protein/permease n=1 Tax=Spiroplasma turonicum TaxID=216946 RepID=A0A0K1P6Y0_9MOLU|nr:ABC transporter ATP-binding protein [Spiroplasma turonicum]AKU80066.1 ABC transporter ATP-binding protein/permease [Spiroplasma turonicum]ALX71068.1 ABC transporter ATP-binding protein [Spiroplasma turonicum]
MKDKEISIGKPKTIKKQRKKAKTFFGIIFKYLKKRPIFAFFIVLLTLLSSITTIVGPKIIQNIMSILMAQSSIDSLGDNPTSDAVNQMLEKLSANGVPIHATLSDGVYTCYSNFFGLNFGWKDWIYLQIVFFILLAIFTFLSNYLTGLLGKNIEISLRNKALENLVKQDMSYYSDKKIGEILTKIVSDTQIVGEQGQIIPVTLLSAIFTFFGSLIMMVTIDLNLTLVVIVTMATIMTVMFSTFGIVKKLMFKTRDSITNINGDVTDRIGTINLIKASGTEVYETERFKFLHKDYFKKSKSLIKLQSIIITVMVAGISSIQMVIVIAAALLYNGNGAQLSIVLSSFISGVGTMVGPLMQLARVNAGMVQASTSSARIDAIIKAQPRLNPHYNEGEGKIITSIDGDIIFKDIEFRYPEKPNKVVLPVFNFVFEKGKSYAFVGETGAGKSTIAKLLLRFYDPYKGEILINNGINLKDVQLASYLKHVGYVEQEPQILFGTVADNIRYGKFDATDDEIIDAAKKAELDNIVKSWPDGYDTILGERGFILSGGQKQRLVIARMFLKDPKLLVLDEATSALDNIIEKEIQTKLEALMDGRTTVTIAHRLSTIKNADKIIVLGRDQGIVQVGTFDELKKIPGHFKNLYEAGLMD